MSITYVTCVQEGDFPLALTPGRKYPLIAIYEETKRVYIQGDNARKAWFPFSCFSLGEDDRPDLDELLIELSGSGPIERSMRVEIVFPSGERRWSWLATPRILEKDSELIEGTEVWIHYHHTNLILVSVLTEETARKAIDHIHKSGELLACTLPC